MPLEIVRNDITKMEVDAIVNASDKKLSGGGGVDRSIHMAAGKELSAECRAIGRCETGDAKITGAYALPCKYVIHTVGPIWHGGKYGEKELLESCYKRSLEIAKEHGCETVAFPLISAGVYRYPKDQALKVAVDTIVSFLLDNDMTVYIVIFDRKAYNIGTKLFSEITQYIDDRYEDELTDRLFESRRIQSASMPGALPSYANTMSDNSDYLSNSDKRDLDELIDEIDESFSQMLLRKIDERGISDSECYKKANIDRKLFSKIRGDVNYRPSKPTVIAFAIALELSLDETKNMLKKAGFALSHSYKFDIIIEYFISKGIYNVFEINEALFAFDQNLLGV